MRRSSHRLQQGAAVIVELLPYLADHFGITACADLAASIQVLHHILPEPEFLLDKPIDQLLHQPVNARGSIANHISIELFTHALRPNQIEDAPEANRLVKKAVSAFARF